MKRALLALLLTLPPTLSAAETPHMMVVAANPQAAKAGYAILQAGGSAIDAAVAVQAVLGLVEPQASGIGGGAMILYYDAAHRGVTYYDGRETAPAAAGPGLFLDHDGKPMDFLAAVLGGRSVGVPGAVAALELAYKDHGSTPWAKLFDPAIQLAEGGFIVSPRLAELIAYDTPRLQRSASLSAYLIPHGPPDAGAVLKNPPYAATLRHIAADGANGLLRGPVAADIVAAVRDDPNQGLMTTDDLAAYHPIKREPVCGTYRGDLVCSAGPPSAGGIAVLESLGVLSHFDLPHMAPDSPDAAMLLLEAERLAMADRDAYGGDADRVAVPVAGLTDPAYLATRAQLIDLDHAMPTVRAGNPDWGTPPPAQKPQPEHGTSDVAIVDAHGNAVSMTTTVEGEFGSHLFVDGFVLNNQLTDFSFLPTINGRPVANQVQPGKRPRSSMAPTLILDADRHLVAVLGSAGGPRIPGYVVQAAVGVIDWKLDPVRALALGHEGSMGSRTELEAATPAASLAPTLTARGETLTVNPMGSGSALIVVTPPGLAGAADPRRDGAAAGQ